MPDPIHASINMVHSMLCPPGAFDVRCSAADGLIQLRPDGPGRYLNCAVEHGCPALLKPGCAKLAHGVMPAPAAPGAVLPAQTASPPTRAPGDGSADLIYD